jgi:uncharacterized protein YggE
MNSFLSDLQKRRLFNSVITVLVLLAVFLAALAINTFKENSYIGKGNYATNTITVNGKGEVFAVPDTGSFSFSVVEEGKTVAVAQDLASRKINAIIGAIKALGVAEKDIKTIGYNSYPKYEYIQANLCTNGYCPPGKQILTGYEVNQTISVKVRKTADAGGVLTKVGDLGASNISGLNFVVDNLDAVQADARDKAIQDAKNKANVLAKSLGVKLVKIVSFNEAGNQPIYYAMDAMKSQSMSGGQIAPSVAPQLPTGENDIVSNVSITYEVE